MRAVALDVSNVRIEAINNKTELAVHTGYGFRSIGNLIALVVLRCPNLPTAQLGGRNRSQKLVKPQNYLLGYEMQKELRKGVQMADRYECAEAVDSA